MFDKEFNFFKKHQDELVAKYEGRILVIRGETVEGDYETHLAAYLDAQERFEPGTYMIQECIAGPEAYTAIINSAVVAA